MTLLTYLDLDPARHPQGDEGRLALRCLDERRLIVGYAIPGFLFAILLIVLFAGGSFLRLVPAARPVVGQLGAAQPRRQKIVDYLWHLALPLTAMALGAFTP
jgi:microcin C transport system permease protein